MKITIPTLVIMLVGAMFLALCLGSVTVPFADVWNDLIYIFSHEGEPSTSQTILYEIRMPRIIFAAISGAVLSLVGLMMQTVSQNYLADPYILGVSSGASTGAVAAIVFGILSTFGSYSVYMGAFLGAILATAIVLTLTGKSSNPIKLILIGIGVSALFSALTLFIIYGAPNEALVRSAMFWVLGSFASIQWKSLPMATIVCAALLLFLWFYRHELDILLLGNRDAHHLGLSVLKVQKWIVLVSSLAIATVVSLSGIVGFIGLIVPHIARLFSSPRHGRLIFYTALIGAIIMVLADIVARVLYRPQEIPIGVVTSVVGAPIFIWIIYKRYGDMF